jgi:hypothetical protein
LDPRHRSADKVQGGRIVSSSSGKCAFGFYGTVFVEAANPDHFEVSVLSNQREFILVTHTGSGKINPAVMNQTHQIALMTGCE